MPNEDMGLKFKELQLPERILKALAGIGIPNDEIAKIGPQLKDLPQSKSPFGDLAGHDLKLPPDVIKKLLLLNSPFPIDGPIYDTWESWNSLHHIEELGWPTGNEAPTFDKIGRIQFFQTGIICWHPEVGAHVVKGAISSRWLELGREQFGYPLTNESPTPDRIGRFNHFRALHLPDTPEASIYWHPDTGAHEIYGAIRNKWASLGWEQSFLGYPTSGEVDFPPDSGRISNFQNGSIYFWPDTGAIELNEIVVHYTGFNCFGSTEQGSDEPYVILSTISPTGTSTIRTQIFEGVDGGESVPGLIELYRGKPHGLVIVMVLMEHDVGDADKYKDVVKKAVDGGFDAVKALLNLIPVVGPILSAIASPALNAIEPDVTEALNDLLGTGDDLIGLTQINLSPKQLVLLASRTGNSVEKSIQYKLPTPLISGDGGSYKVYFGIVPA